MNSRIGIYRQEWGVDSGRKAINKVWVESIQDVLNAYRKLP